MKRLEVLSSQYSNVNHIDWFFKTVLETGYIYFEWKDQVYKVNRATRSYESTGMKYSTLVDE